jgi:hypothetical protein
MTQKHHCLHFNASKEAQAAGIKSYGPQKRDGLICYEFHMDGSDGTQYKVRANLECQPETFRSFMCHPQIRTSLRILVRKATGYDEDVSRFLSSGSLTAEPPIDPTDKILAGIY